MVFSTIRRLRYLYSGPPMDNFVFTLCYRWTVLILVTFSFIATCRLCLGHSFVCMGAYDVDYMNTYCYDEGVYTLPAKLVIEAGKESEGVIDPTVENIRKYQTYYPWVNLLFLVQAFIFYLPHLLWKTYERGYIYRMTAGVQKFFDTEERRGLELCYLAKYALVTQGKHKRYMGIYIFFEICNYAISIALTLWLIYFFDVTGVPNFLPNVIRSWSDFKHFYFPSSAICEWSNFASSGYLYTQRTKCHLPLNALYMKMFLFLHAWYILLAVLCGLVLLYRIILLVPAFRSFVMKLSSPLSERSVLMCVCYSLSYSDWFFLSRLQKAMTDIDFAQMVDKMSLVTQGKDDLKDLTRRSLSEDALKDFDSSNITSAV